MAKGSLRVNGIIVDTDGEIKASSGDSIVIREDDGSAVITVDTNGKTSIGGAMDVGVNDTGYDVKFFGDTSGNYWLWDTSADGTVLVGSSTQTGNAQLTGTLTVGENDTGHDVYFYGATSGKHLLWDQSGDELLFATSTKLSFHDAAGGENILASADGHLEVNAGTTLDITAPTVDINAATLVQIDGAVSVGVNDTGHDVKFFGATSGAYAEWDESADELELRGGAATPGKLLLSTAETTVVDGNKLGQIDFQAPLDSAGTDAILVGASIWAEADATFSSSINSTDLVFATGNSETATEKMRIDSTGQVTFADGAIDVDIASHDGTNGLKLGGTLITTSAADLNNSATTGKAIAMAIVFGG